MKQLVRFELDDGSPVYVEVEDREGGGEERRVARGEEVAERAESRFNEVLARVKPAAEAALNVFRELNTPQEITLEFGIKFNAKIGAIFASADSEATFKVALKWSNSP